MFHFQEITSFNLGWIITVYL